MDKDSDKNQLIIGKKTFLSSVLILLALMIISGILTRVVPTGSYERMVVDGKTVVNPESFRYINEAPLSIWNKKTGFQM